MWTKQTTRRLLEMAVGLSTAGIVLGTSCSSTGLQAVVAGIEAAAHSISEDDRDISFGDWLLSELDD